MRTAVTTDVILPESKGTPGELLATVCMGLTAVVGQGLALHDIKAVTLSLRRQSRTRHQTHSLWPAQTHRYYHDYSQNIHFFMLTRELIAAYRTQGQVKAEGLAKNWHSFWRFLSTLRRLMDYLRPRLFGMHFQINFIDQKNEVY